MLNVKQRSCEYQILKCFSLTRSGNRTLVYRLREEHSYHLGHAPIIIKTRTNLLGNLWLTLFICLQIARPAGISIWLKRQKVIFWMEKFRYLHFLRNLCHLCNWGTVNIPNIVENFAVLHPMVFRSTSPGQAPWIWKKKRLSESNQKRFCFYCQKYHRRNWLFQLDPKFKIH